MLDRRKNAPRLRQPHPAYLPFTALLLVAASSCDQGTSPVSPEPDPDVSSVLVVLAGADSIPSVGDTVELRAATRTPTLQVLPEGAVDWFSSDSSLISVDSIGRVVSLGVGAVVITAVYRGAEAHTTLYSDPELAALEVTLPSVPLQVGSITQLSATAVDIRGRLIPRQKVRWGSESTRLINVSPSGMVEALAPGLAELSVRAGDVETSVHLDIHESPIRSVVIAPAAGSIEEGLRRQLVARVEDRNGTEVPDAVVHWTISDESHALILGDKLIGIRAGTVVLVAKSGGRADTVAVTVTPTQVATMSLQPATASLELGAALSLASILKDESGAILYGRELMWTSSDPSVAVVDDGQVSALEPGYATITASVGAKSASAALTVGDQDGGGGGGAGGPPRSAFSGAQGWGAQALTRCSRAGLEILRVNSLGDDGPGSLREAVADAQNQVLSIVVFDVAGRIRLNSEIEIKDQQCLYIAGQTAPGGGITISSPASGIRVKGDSRDIAVRYLRFRGGFQGDRLGQVNVYIGAGTDIILDHLSTSWTTDKLIVIYKGLVSWARPISRVTVQNTVLSEVLAAHPTAMQITGQDNGGATEWRALKEISLHRNLFAHNSHRNPMLNTFGTALSNNVIYNWNQGAIQSTRESRLDAINNYFKPGPMTGTLLTWEVTWSCGPNGGFTPSIHVAGNIGPHNSSGTGDQFGGGGRVVACYYNTGTTIGQALPSAYRRASPLPAPPVPVGLVGAGQAYGDVLNGVGASARLACDGGWIENRDAIDARVVRDVRNGSGIRAPISHENEVGGFVSIASGSRCADQDNDGMPDEYEARNGLNPLDPRDALLDRDGDGFTNVEEYINGEGSV